MKTETEYPFKEKFEYAHKGDMVKAQFITMKCPKGKHIEYIAPVRNALMQAMMWASKQAEDNELDSDDAVEAGSKEATEASGELYMNTLEMCPTVDTLPVITCVMAMLKSGLGELDGEIKFTQPLINDLSVTDTYGIVGEFIAAFMTAS